jgi:hypothetical protein
MNIKSLSEKEIFRKTDLLVIILLLLFSLLIYLFFLSVPNGSQAVIKSGDEVIGTYLLSSVTGEKIITVKGDQNIEVTISITSSGARVVSSGCPDKTCVRTGLISKSGETAVCLPARVSVTITGGSSDNDGVTFDG